MSFIYLLRPMFTGAGFLRRLISMVAPSASGTMISMDLSSSAGPDLVLLGQQHVAVPRTSAKISDICIPECFNYQPMHPMHQRQRRLLVFYLISDSKSYRTLESTGLCHVTTIETIGTTACRAAGIFGRRAATKTPVERYLPVDLLTLRQPATLHRRGDPL